jgi:hypothetical protein
MVQMQFCQVQVYQLAVSSLYHWLTKKHTRNCLANNNLYGNILFLLQNIDSDKILQFVQIQTDLSFLSNLIS